MVNDLLQVAGVHRLHLCLRSVSCGHGCSRHLVNVHRMIGQGEHRQGG
ncbi:Uncharacterised protein [Segatella copri]|nr:Uncharacterised protein [Segatella copri]